MGTKKEIDPDLNPQGGKDDKKKSIKLSAWLRGLLSKKYAVWITAASVILILGTAYFILSFEESDEASFAGKILKPFLAEDQPFVERNSFIFLPSGNEEMDPEKKGEETVLNESSKRGKSASSEWWLNSGGIMNIGSDEFATNLGPLSQDSRWRKLYAKTNPEDTEEGYFPQNIFRLVTRSQWDNFSQSVYFKIEKVNLSRSENRNESNGVLFFNRYQDGDNLYYAGIRVDGHAVIKKKIKDRYYTLEEKDFFYGDEEYDEEENPNLIPTDSWIGIKSEVRNIEDDTVEIKFYMDPEQKGEWQLVLETKDRPGENGKKTFLEKGYAGIRADFMDVRFRNYEILKL